MWQVGRIEVTKLCTSGREIERERERQREIERARERQTEMVMVMMMTMTMMTEKLTVDAAALR